MVRHGGESRFRADTLSLALTTAVDAITTDSKRGLDVVLEGTLGSGGKEKLSAFVVDVFEMKHVEGVEHLLLDFADKRPFAHGQIPDEGDDSVSIKWQ